MSVLLFSAAAAIGLVYVNDRIERVMAEALDNDESLRARLERQSTEQTLLYLLATRERSFRGLGIDNRLDVSEKDPFTGSSFVPSSPTLTFDGAVYAGYQGCSFSLQDSASLVSLRSKNLSELKKYLLSKGLLEGTANGLVAKLKDYVDRDSSIRLDGGEKISYERQESRWYPRNRYLSNPRELFNVLGWGEILSEPAFSDIFNELSIHVGDQLNFNSMTESRLARVLLDSSKANTIVRSRTEGYFSSAREVLASVGIADPDLTFRVALFPSKHIIVRIRCAGGLRSFEMGVTMTPKSQTKPWEIDYSLELPDFGKTNEKVLKTVGSSEEELGKQHFIFSDI